MTELQPVRWDNDANPKFQKMAAVLYDLRRYDAEDHPESGESSGLLSDPLTLDAIYEGAEVQPVATFDALAVPKSKLEKVARMLNLALSRAGSDLSVESYEVSEPFKRLGRAQMAVIFKLSDQQTITAYFHNPDQTPAKLTDQDMMVSWKWLLNKLDITVVVAPERGIDLTPKVIGMRIMKLAEANSEKFKKVNAKAIADAERKRELKEEIIPAKEQRLAELEKELELVKFEAEEREIESLMNESDEDLALKNLIMQRDIEAQQRGIDIEYVKVAKFRQMIEHLIRVHSVDRHAAVGDMEKRRNAETMKRLLDELKFTDSRRATDRDRGRWADAILAAENYLKDFDWNAGTADDKAGGGTGSVLENYQSIKDKYPGAIVLYRMGDFYEIYGDDAKKAAKSLGITLASRSFRNDQQKTPMTGVPAHDAMSYIDSLVAAGVTVVTHDKASGKTEVYGEKNGVDDKIIPFTGSTLEEFKEYVKQDIAQQDYDGIYQFLVEELRKAELAATTLDAVSVSERDAALEKLRSSVKNIGTGLEKDKHREEFKTNETLWPNFSKEIVGYLETLADDEIYADDNSKIAGLRAEWKKLQGVVPGYDPKPRKKTEFVTAINYAHGYRKAKKVFPEMNTEVHKFVAPTYIGEAYSPFSALKSIRAAVTERFETELESVEVANGQIEAYWSDGSAKYNTEIYGDGKGYITVKRSDDEEKKTTFMSSDMGEGSLSFRLNLNELIAFAAEPPITKDAEPEHYSKKILNALVANHGWKHEGESVTKDVGGAVTSGEFNPEGKRVVSASFDDRGRYLELYSGFDKQLDVDVRDGHGLDPEQPSLRGTDDNPRTEDEGAVLLADFFDKKVNKWAAESADNPGSLTTPVKATDEQSKENALNDKPKADDYSSAGDYYHAMSEWREKWKEVLQQAKRESSNEYEKINQLRKKLANAEKRLSAAERKAKNSGAMPVVIAIEARDKIAEEIVKLKQEISNELSKLRGERQEEELPPNEIKIPGVEEPYMSEEEYKNKEAAIKRRITVLKKKLTDRTGGGLSLDEKLTLKREIKSAEKELSATVRERLVVGTTDPSYQDGLINHLMGDPGKPIDPTQSRIESLRTLPIEDYEKAMDTLMDELEVSGEIEQYEFQLEELDRSRNAEFIEYAKKKLEAL